MAVKTKDLSVNVADFTNEGGEFDAKGKNALKIESWYGGLGNLNEMYIEGDKLIVKLTSSQKITIKNYQSLKYLKNEDDNLFDFIEAGTVKNKNEITFNSRNLSATGTIYSDTITASNYPYTPKGNSKKGLTIDGGKGNDSISGTDYNDVIKGGDGNDAIYGGEGNDTITGGNGKNTISYRAGDGNDVINLTKGENFTLSILTAESENDIKLEYANKNKDVRVYADKDDLEEYITLKNFGTKDILNNATKNTPDTSSAKIRFNPDQEESFEKNLKEMTIKSQATSNFTGTWLNDEIDASTYQLKNKKGEQIEDSSKKGLTLKGGDGDNIIYGSKYSDVIYAGNDADSIIGGKGNDTIIAGQGKTTVIYASGHENDVIDMSKAKDVEILTNLSDAMLANFDYEYSSNHKDLKLYFDKTNKNEFLTLKNFCVKDKFGNVTLISDNLSQDIDLKDLIIRENPSKNYTGTWLQDSINAAGYEIFKDKAKTIVDDNYAKRGLLIDGKEGNDYINGSNYSDTLYGGAGNDEIYGGSGNDKIYGGDGNDIIYASAFYSLEEDSGNNVIYGDKGDDKIYGDDGNDKLYGGDGSDEIHGGKGNDTIYGDKGLINQLYGDEGNDVIYGGNDTLGMDSIEGGKGNDTITGGKGVTCVTYNDGDGKDVINITKGETLHINANIENTKNPTFSYSENKKDLIISFGSDNETITLKNFVARKDANAVSLVKNSSNTYELLKNNTDSAPIIATLNIDKNFTGTWMKDLILANETLYKKVGKNLVAKTEDEKGLTLDGGAGNDSIYGSNCSDIIKGGDGDDLIDGGKGNDTLTGGKGHNIYFYKAGDGYDVINITKDEELEVTLTDAGNYDLNYGNGNKDLIISRGGDLNGSITLKNFTAKDITKSATLTNQYSTSVDLKAATITKVINNEKSFTGSWMKDKINASYATKNLTLRGGDGNDTIYGGQGNDKIYGDNGNDSIEGGAGNDVIYGGDGDDIIKGGEGNDTLTGGKGRNTYEYEKDGSIDVINVTKGEDVVIKINGTNNYHISYINGNKDLKIQDQGDPNGYFILKNFTSKDITSSATLLKQSGGNIDLKEATVYASGVDKNFTGTWLNDRIYASYATKNLTLRGGDGNDTIYGGQGNDKIYGDNGNDSIEGGAGNDTITGGNGENHIKYSMNDGNDVINLTKGEDFYLHFDGVTNVNNAEWEFKGNDLRIWAYGKAASDQFVTIKNANKMIDNTNTAKIIINNSQQLDLKTFDYNTNSLMSQVTAWSSSSGTSSYSMTASTDPAADIGTLATAFSPEDFRAVI